MGLHHLKCTFIKQLVHFETTRAISVMENAQIDTDVNWCLLRQSGDGANPFQRKTICWHGASDRDSFRTTDVDDFQSMRSAQFTKHAMNMVANGLLGQLKAVRDLFITETLRDQPNKLLLAIG